jgi:hypothetical protein
MQYLIFQMLNLKMGRYSGLLMMDIWLWNKESVKVHTVKLITLIARCIETLKIKKHKKLNRYKEFNKWQSKYSIERIYKNQLSIYWIDKQEC